MRCRRPYLRNWTIGDPARAEFSCGTRVTVDFSDNTFEILYPDGRRVTEL